MPAVASCCLGTAIRDFEPGSVSGNCHFSSLFYGSDLKSPRVDIKWLGVLMPMEEGN